jgi:hypothetical protein
MKYEEDLAPAEETRTLWGVVAVILFVILAFGTLTLIPALGAEQCDLPESVITEAIDSSPDRLVAKIEGKDLNTFLGSMTKAGLLTGTLWRVERIYIVSAKMLPGYDTPHVWLFFIQDGCLIAKIPSIRKVIEDILP